MPSMHLSWRLKASRQALPVSPTSSIASSTPSFLSSSHEDDVDPFSPLPCSLIKRPSQLTKRLKSRRHASTPAEETGKSHSEPVLQRREKPSRAKKAFSSPGPSKHAHLTAKSSLPPPWSPQLQLEAFDDDVFPSASGPSATTHTARSPTTPVLVVDELPWKSRAAYSSPSQFPPPPPPRPPPRRLVPSGLVLPFADEPSPPPSPSFPFPRMPRELAGEAMHEPWEKKTPTSRLARPPLVSAFTTDTTVRLGSPRSSPSPALSVIDASETAPEDEEGDEENTLAMSPVPVRHYEAEKEPSLPPSPPDSNRQRRRPPSLALNSVFDKFQAADEHLQPPFLRRRPSSSPPALRPGAVPAPLFLAAEERTRRATVASPELAQVQHALRDAAAVLGPRSATVRGKRDGVYVPSDAGSGSGSTRQDEQHRKSVSSGEVWYSTASTLSSSPVATTFTSSQPSSSSSSPLISLPPPPVGLLSLRQSTPPRLSSSRRSPPHSAQPWQRVHTSRRPAPLQRMRSNSLPPPLRPPRPELTVKPLSPPVYPVKSRWSSSASFSSTSSSSYGGAAADYTHLFPLPLPGVQSTAPTSASLFFPPAVPPPAPLPLPLPPSLPLPLPVTASTESLRADLAAECARSAALEEEVRRLKRVVGVLMGLPPAEESEVEVDLLGA
ncbi:hypothetical protein JCM8097_001333 [Rhodosporidiobolus ruineniae]